VPYANTADLYDLIYLPQKDYAADSSRLADFVRRLSPGAIRLLDVACGTGEHARHLSTHGLKVNGVDLEPAFVARAKAKVPSGEFVVADLADFDLGSRYDAVVCLFGAIGFPSKITSGHLARWAYIYVRQSTEQQVRFNTESVEPDGAGFAAEQPVDREPGQLPLGVPEGRLHPPVAPAQVGHLAQPLLDQADVCRVLADQVRPQQLPQTLPFAAHGRARGVPFHALVRGHPEQGEAAFHLGKAGDPTGVEGSGKGPGDVEQLDSADPAHAGTSRKSVARMSGLRTP
jgi:SAM-dependent methyltransferase